MGLDLITDQELKDYATISSTNSDAIIELLIPKVSDFVKNYCCRTFVDYVGDDKVETHSGGYKYIYLSDGPIISLNLVEYSVDYGVTYTTLVDGTDYVWDTENDRVACISSEEYFPEGINAFRITYNAGYEETPEDLKLAVMDLVLYYMKHDMAVKSNNGVGRNSVAVEYITTAGLPSHIRRVLDLYMLEYI